MINTGISTYPLNHVVGKGETLSQIQLIVVKSFRVSLCEREQPPKIYFWWDPKMPWKSVFEVS